ncbi:MAG: glycosyl transferase [Clostridia bacterium]|nr:glycosyl transferase [Clostridia bacterium]
MKIVKYIKNPMLIIKTFKMKRLFGKVGQKMPDKIYLEKVYKLRMGRKLDLDNPQTYNEKLQWLKLYDRKPEYTKMVDKYAVKDYVAKKIGAEHIIKTLGVWDKFDDIDFTTLPNQFVLKTTHDSGGVVICKDKNVLNMKEARKRIEWSLNRKYYYIWREWPYKDVKPRIIAEEYMVDESGYELKDYKFFCFNGKVKALFVAKDRTKVNEETKFDFFDENFNHLPFTNGHPNSEPPYFKPENFEKMKELAEKLSIGIPHVRVDFYNINGKIYFGELTFSHWSGLTPFNPEEWDYEFGSWIELPCRIENGK